MAGLLGADALSKFLRAAAGRPFSYGEHDCLLWLGDCVMMQTGIDPAAPWRWRYSTKAEALRFVVEAGGMAALIETALKPIGRHRRESGKRGDIAIVAPLGEPEMGAILLNGASVSLAETGLVIRRSEIAPVVAAWAL